MSLLVDRCRQAEVLRGSEHFKDGFQRVYADLRRQARRLFSREPEAHTLGPTALVHEVFLRLAERGVDRWPAEPARVHALAAAVMQHILVDHARAKRMKKRGGGRRRVALDAALALFEESRLDVIVLQEALGRLATLSPRQEQIVLLRCYGGCTMPQIAECLGVSLSTVESEFRLARAWLRRELLSE